METVDWQNRVKALEEEVKELKVKLREEETYGKTLRRLNDSYWKIVVKHRKRLAEMGVHIKDGDE